MYWARLQRLPYQEENGPDHRAELDSELGVMQWQVGDGAASRRTYEEVDPDAPAWWHGDEEASSSFIRSMGVQLNQK